MSGRPEHCASFLRSVFTMENTRGALITMPHKVSTVARLDEATPTVQIAGSCNAVRRAADALAGRLQAHCGALQVSPGPKIRMALTSSSTARRWA